MQERKNQKLVRDRIPEIIAKKGEAFQAHFATEDEYVEALGEKLLEEAKEAVDAKFSTEELADVLEVIEAMCTHKGVSLKDVCRVQEKKRIERGGFKKRIILES